MMVISVCRTSVCRAVGESSMPTCSRRMMGPGLSGSDRVNSGPVVGLSREASGC
jgi:hypothetical protein